VLNIIDKKEDEVPKISQIEGLLKCKKSMLAIMLCHGGSFSIAIFNKDKCIYHKSDKRYVVRKKQGQR